MHRRQESEHSWMYLGRLGPQNNCFIRSLNPIAFWNEKVEGVITATGFLTCIAITSRSRYPAGNAHSHFKEPRNFVNYVEFTTTY